MKITPQIIHLHQISQLWSFTSATGLEQAQTEPPWTRQGNGMLTLDKPLYRHKASGSEDETSLRSGGVRAAGRDAACPRDAQAGICGLFMDQL